MTAHSTIAPRWRKVFGDIAGNPVRCALAVLAMTAGAFGVGAIVTSYTILTRELAATYANTRPASALVYTQGIDAAALAAVRTLPGVADAEARPTIRARISRITGSRDWHPLTLFVVHDFGRQEMDVFTKNEGAWPPADDEVLIERSSMSVAHAAIGDRVVMKTADGVEHSLRIGGTVHAPGLAPGWMDHHVSGFVSERFIARTDRPKEISRLMIVVSGDRLDEMHIRNVSASVRALLERRGSKVTSIEVPPPGRHPHADQMATFLFLLGAFGALTLALSAVLVATMIHALLTEQVRQVGVMKAIGATTRQIASLYLVQVSLLAGTALAIGMPLGFLAGRAYVAFSAGILNATIATDAVPFWAIALQVAAGLLVPLIVAAGPVLRASRIPIHEAFSNGIGARPFGLRPFDRWLSRRAWLPRPLMLSLRTAFHRRGRLALTVTTLAVGGAVFVTTLNVAAAWRRALDDDGRARRYDLDVRLAAPRPVAELAKAIALLPEVTRAEYWSESAATLASPVGRGPSTDRRPPLAERGGSLPATGGAPVNPRLANSHGIDDERVAVIHPAVPTALLALPLQQGRWLQAGDRDVAVINQAMLARVPWLRLGDSLQFRIDDRDVAWRVVGVVKELAPFPIAYAPQQPPLATSRSLRVVTRRHDAASLRAASRALERSLPGVTNVQSLAEMRQAFADHLVIINTALTLASVLVVLVGALALTSTMSLSVTERTRELGVLSAIGARPRTIARDIVLEGTLIGVLSWCLALAAAVPLTLVLNAASGQIFIKSRLDFVMSSGGAAIWLAVVIILSALASFYPAWRASRLTVREALAYE